MTFEAQVEELKNQVKISKEKQAVLEDEESTLNRARQIMKRRKEIEAQQATAQKDAMRESVVLKSIPSQIYQDADLSKLIPIIRFCLDIPMPWQYTNLHKLLSALDQPNIINDELVTIVALSQVAISKTPITTEFI
jgi:hypothetical protein